MGYLDTCAEIVKKIFNHFPLQKTIVFEANPPFCDNTWPVYRYLVEKKHIDRDFKIIWLTENYHTDGHLIPPGNEFVRLMNYGKKNNTYRDKIYFSYLMNTSVGLVYCNRILGLNRPDQYSIMLQHGMPLKASNGGYCIHDNCTECLCVSEFFSEYQQNDFDISREKQLFGGFPRNDYLFTKENIRKKMGIEGYKKVIVWLPTYRKSNVASMHGFDIEITETGIPTINTVEEIERLDSFLRENNMLVLFKAHPVQPVDSSIADTLTNFKVISNDTLSEFGVQLYELLGQTDALITDYSSVYYDYLLTEKPIGLTIDDIDDYINARGFVYDDPFEILKGEKVLDNDGLIIFMEHIRDGVDEHRDERLAVKEKIHTIKESGSTEFVAERIYAEIMKRIK